MATSTASGHQVVLFEAVVGPAEALACSFTIMGGNGSRLPLSGHTSASHTTAPATREQASLAVADHCGSYFLSTVPFSITVLDGMSGFTLSSAVMKTSKSL